MAKLYNASELMNGKPYYSQIPIWYYHGDIDIEEIPLKVPSFGDGKIKALLKDSVPFMVIKKKENEEIPKNKLIQFLAANDMGTMNVCADIRIFYEA